MGDNDHRPRLTTLEKNACHIEGGGHSAQLVHNIDLLGFNKIKNVFYSFYSYKQ